MKEKIKVRYVLAGLLIGLSGAILASSVSIPNTFTAGTAAIAAQVNANFTALSNAVNDNYTRIATLETTLVPISVTSLNPAPNYQFVAAGYTYQILQKQVLGFSNDAVHTIKYPSSLGGGILGVGVVGRYSDTDPTPNCRDDVNGKIGQWTIETIIDGRAVLIGEYLSGDLTSTSQSIGVCIAIDSETIANFLFTTSTNGTARTRTERETARQELRTLLQYINIS